MAVVESPKSAQFSELSDRTFWNELNPDLSITDYPVRGVINQYPVPDMTNPLRQIVHEGYLQLPPVIPAADISQLAAAATKIFRLGIPPVFGFVYDEFWQILLKLSGILQPIVGPNHLVRPAEFWIFYVDREKSGWIPHRDIASHTTLSPDGRPKIRSAWIPLTDVGPLNGCMYVLPTNRDRYLPGRLRRKSVGLKDLQNVRALPAKAGSVLCWNSHILHWGSRSSEWADQPRISVAVYLQSHDYEPQVCTDAMANNIFLLNNHSKLTFERRIELISTAIQFYRGTMYREFPDVADALLKVTGGHSTSWSRWAFLNRLFSP